MIAYTALLLLVRAVAAGQDAHLPSRFGTCDPWRLAADSSVCLASQPAEANQTIQGKDAPSILAPWVKGTGCRRTTAGAEYCAYTLPSFNGGEGLSMITSPEKMAELAALAALKEYAQSPVQGSAASTLYAAVDVPGKGMGLAATKPIRRGTRIMARTPALMVDGRALDNLSKGQVAELLGQAVEALPSAHSDALLNLSTHTGSDDHLEKVYKIFAINAFRTGVGEDGEVLHSVFTEGTLWQSVRR